MDINTLKNELVATHHELAIHQNQIQGLEFTLKELTFRDKQSSGRVGFNLIANRSPLGSLRWRGTGRRDDWFQKGLHATT